MANRNGDSGADISGATFLFDHLFRGGPAPVEPFPSCGVSELGADKGNCETAPASCPP